ncbi:MAG: DoxX family protein [Bryobacteraceae bacterium]|nr:DoxX family protein [Bryobacterales bacterium]MEB2360686.1 DoxX family protein [Bryobacterales bacterium]NUN02462.1 DoxX family protein [Bryobacteraceae bacterium]
MSFVFFLGRVLFGGYFLYNGIHHFRNHESLTQYAAAKGVPNPDAAVSATGALLLLGGASIVLGLKPKLGAAALTMFLAGVSPMMHGFWRVEDPGQRMNETINFTKNVALLGAVLALMGTEEPWPASLPHCPERTGMLTSESHPPSSPVPV